MTKTITIRGHTITVVYEIEPEYRTYDTYDPARVDVQHIEVEAFGLFGVNLQDEILALLL